MNRRSEPRSRENLDDRIGDRAELAQLLLDGSHSPSGPTRAAANRRRIRIRGVVKPEPDIKQLSRAIVLLIEHLAEDERRNGS